MSKPPRKRNQDEGTSADSVGYYLAEIRKIPYPTLEEEQDLVARRDRGDVAAVNILWESHLRFVVHRAKKCVGLGVPVNDLIQEGGEALRPAVQKFEPAKAYPQGLRLRHYARVWIKRAIEKAINDDKGSARGFTASRIKDILKYDKVYQRFWCEHAREPTDEEIAQRCAWAPAKVSRVREDSIAYRRPESWDDEPRWSESSEDTGLPLSEQLPATENAMDDVSRESRMASGGDVTYAASEREACKRQLQHIFFACLSPEYREVLLWRFAREMKREDIATKRETKGPSVSRIIRECAIPALAAELKKAGMGKEDVRKVLGYFFDDEVIKQQVQEAYERLSADNQRHLLQQFHKIRPVVTTQAGCLATEIFAAACKAADLPRDNVTSDAVALSHTLEALRTALQGAGMPGATIQEVLDIFPR